MRYVLPWERWAREEGIEQGIQQGVQQGIQQGVQRGKQEERQRFITEILGKRLAAVLHGSSRRTDIF